MSQGLTPPPFELDSAVVLAYASTAAPVRYTGRTTLYVDGAALGPVPCLVLAHNNYAPHDYLLFSCSADWEVLGAAGYKSKAIALERAEVAYAGISAAWVHVA